MAHAGCRTLANIERTTLEGGARKVQNTSPNESSITAELAAAEEAADAVIGDARADHIRLGGAHRVSPEEEGETQSGRSASTSTAGTHPGFEIFQELEAGNPHTKLRQ